MAHLPNGAVADAGVAALQTARAKCSFDVRALTYVLDQGREMTEMRERIQAKVQEDPTLADRGDVIFLDREERVELGWKVLSHVHRRLDALGIEDSFLEKQAYKRELNFMTGADLHDSMFTMTLAGQMDDEQQATWLPLAKSKSIIGAVPELGHGSNLRQLETTATFDVASQTWDIHTPCLTAAKWWPGGLGKTSSHVVLMARLITKGTDHGMHAFLVQIRRQEDHMPMPGVTVGDIGPKIGYLTQDNGFLVFDHVRVPRRAMLMRFAKVDEKGNYSRPPHSKLSYGTMLGVRAGIVLAAGRGLARACTIAVRYSYVRMQFASPSSNKAELSVMEYETQRYKLLPLIATAYAFNFVGFYMWNMYTSLQSDIKGANFSALPEVHAVSSGLKALTTELGVAGIEICRRACGGHGYSKMSGLPELLTDYTAAVTYEGENTLMYFQAARYLIKQVRAAAKGKSLPAGLAHLSPAGRTASFAPAASVDELASTAHLRAVYRARAAHLAFRAHDAIAAGKKHGLSEIDARNAVGVDLVRASKAHCMFLALDKFIDGVEELRTRIPTVYSALSKLVKLFGLFHMEQNLGEFFECGCITSTQAVWIRSEVRRLLPDIVDDSIGLTDAFGFSDAVLNSDLGRSDGNVYRSMFNRAAKTHLNRSQVARGYEKYLKPLLHQQKWPTLNSTAPRSKL